jgi:hypothetical protein
MSGMLRWTGLDRSRALATGRADDFDESPDPFDDEVSELLVAPAVERGALRFPVAEGTDRPDEVPADSPVGELSW